MIPLGLPVEPDVYRRNSRSSLSIASGSQAAGCPRTASCHHTSRPARIGTASPARCTTKTRFTDSRPRVASSTWGLSASSDPRRQLASAVITALQSPSTIRSRSACALNPPNTTECAAPIRAHASIATAASGTIGM
jgi:hypothetical protein